MNTPANTNTEQMDLNQLINIPAQEISAQEASMNIHQASAQQASMNIQQGSIGTLHPNISTLQAAMNAQQTSINTQQNSVCSQQHSRSVHQPSLNAHLPNLASQEININSQQINHMNLRGHPMPIINAQPIALNMTNQSINLHGQQIGMGMNPQLMNINIHTQQIPFNMNSQNMIHMHTPQLNVHASQLNLIHQPININAQNCNMHPQQMDMTTQQYSIYQMQLQQQIAAQEMFLNQQQTNANSSHINANTQSVVTSAQQTNNEGGSNSQLPAESIDRNKVSQWILELNDPSTRENALIELGKRREEIPDLAVLIWHGFGTAAALLQEIMSIYSAINPAVLSASQSNRVCNALALLQCVAAHSETRPLFIAAQFPLFLYPFMHTIAKNRPFEYLRLTCLGVIGALVKNDEPEIIQYLLDTEIIPICLRIMECGSELSKIVATFILQKILADERGLNYICETYERFSHIAMILGKLILTLADNPSARLLKHIVRCYLLLSKHARAREALRQCLPDQLTNTTFNNCLQSEPITRSWIRELLVNLEIP